MWARVGRALSSITASACILLSSAALVHASVKPPRIDELTAASDLIVLARVDSVIGQAVRYNGRARATVLEVWKGHRIKAIDYVSAPQSECDISDAKAGEIVLLFLAKDEGWHIAWSGRGRMLLKTSKRKDYLTHFMDVIFPDNTPLIQAPDTSDPGFYQSVELKTVKELVQKAVDRQRIMQHLEFWLLAQSARL
jgi:hypothetical protein